MKGTRRHTPVIYVLLACIAVAEGRDVEVGGDALHKHSSPDATGTSILRMIVGRLESSFIEILVFAPEAQEVEETAGFARLGDGL